jgi:hypothetical protein
VVKFVVDYEHADFHRKSCCSPYNVFGWPGCEASDPEPNPDYLKIRSGHGNQFWIHPTDAEGRTGCRFHETSQETNICSYTVKHGGKYNGRPVKHVTTAHIYLGKIVTLDADFVRITESEEQKIKIFIFLKSYLLSLEGWRLRL